MFTNNIIINNFKVNNWKWSIAHDNHQLINFHNHKYNNRNHLIETMSIQPTYYESQPFIITSKRITPSFYLIKHKTSPTISTLIDFKENIKRKFINFFL